MNYAPEKLRQILASEIDCEHLQVAGDGRHFEALIVSEAFSGLNRVRRHQLVYAALGGGGGGRRHERRHSRLIHAPLFPR